MEILNIKNLSFRYPTSNTLALNNFSLEVHEGDFILLLGASGSGKTTVLRLLKPELEPYGEKTGEISIKPGVKTGIVTQDVENQIVSDTVWHNIAFGLENEGLSSWQIRQKVSEVAEFFDITHLFHKKTFELSGGEKQLVTLASVMAQEPDILLLDEPTSQLDPIAARRFTDMIKRLNSEMNLTIIISEHRSAELFNYATNICIMDLGTLSLQGTGRYIAENINNTAIDLPVPIKLYKRLDLTNECPITVNECRKFLTKHFKNDIDYLDDYSIRGNKAIEVKDLYFKRDKNSDDVFKKLNFTAYSGEILTILGGNGAGKTTLLTILQSLLKPYSGKVKRYVTKISLLPQNVKTVFTKDRLSEDLSLISENYAEVVSKMNISHLLDRNPYDLSGGEAQRAAIAKILLTDPDILCLDEPTKGIDANGKKEVGDILKKLKEEGKCIIIVSHDAEFAAEISDRCAFLYDGQIVSEGTVREVFSTNKFYTTTASVIARKIYKNAVTVDDIVNLCKRNGSY